MKKKQEKPMKKLEKQKSKREICATQKQIDELSKKIETLTAFLFTMQHEMALPIKYEERESNENSDAFVIYTLH